MWQPSVIGGKIVGYISSGVTNNGFKIISQLTCLQPNRSPILDSAVSTKQSNFDNRDLSGTLENTNYLKANPKAVTAFFRTLKELNDIDNGNNG
jgi:hypothetical protein